MERQKPKRKKTLMPEPLKEKLFGLLDQNQTYRDWRDAVYREIYKVWEYQEDRRKGIETELTSIFEEHEADRVGTSRETYNKLFEEYRERGERPVEIEKTVRLKSWIAPFVESLRQTIMLEDPARFFPTDLRQGKFYVETSEGVIGCLYWDSMEAERVTVRLWNEKRNCFLEDDERFKWLLEIYPSIGQLLEGYKTSTALYIINAHSLLTDITNVFKKHVIDLAGKELNAELNKSFLDANLYSEKLPLLAYPIIGKGGEVEDVELLEIFSNLFKTAYSQVIRKIGNYESPQRLTYEYEDSGSAKVLWFGVFNLARGGPTVIK